MNPSIEGSLRWARNEQTDQAIPNRNGGGTRSFPRVPPRPAILWSCSTTNRPGFRRAGGSSLADLIGQASLSSQLD